MHGVREEYDAANCPETTLVQNSGTGSRLYRTAVSYGNREHAGSRKERVSGANHTASCGYDWDDRAEDIRHGDAACRMTNGGTIGLVDGAGSLVVEYRRDVRTHNRRASHTSFSRGVNLNRQGVPPRSGGAGCFP